MCSKIAETPWIIAPGSQGADVWLEFGLWQQKYGEI